MSRSAEPSWQPIDDVADQIRPDQSGRASRRAERLTEHPQSDVREYARETDRAPGTVGNLLRRAREKLEGER